MIGKSHSGAGFGGLTRYLLQGKKNEPHPDRVLWTSTRELALDDPKEAALVMRRTAALGRTKEPVHHISISLAPGEHLTREEWELLIDRTLKDLHLDGYQVLIVAHRDTKNEHVHLMVNRVHPETFRAWNRFRDRKRVMDSLRLREPEFGLQVTPHFKDPERLPERLVQAFIHSGELPFLGYARAEARPIFKEARSWEELHERLADKGLYLDRKGQGLVLTDDSRHVKASSVDRAASLKALEARLGPFQGRRDLLPEVDSDLRGDREAELNEQIQPVSRAACEVDAARKSVQEAARRLDTARYQIRVAVQDAFREPVQVEARYFAHLEQAKSVPPLRTGELKELKGIVLRAGRNPIPLGREGNRALEIATGQLPSYAADYLRAREDLANAEIRLAARQKEEAQLKERFRPQFDELEQIRVRSSTRYDRMLSLRPRQQVVLARRHPYELEHAAQRSPEYALRTVDGRQRWIQNLPRDLNRVLDGRLHRTGLSVSAYNHSLTEWTATALHLGLHPLHAVQVLTRDRVPLRDAARAVAEVYATIRHPAKSARNFTFHSVQGLTGVPLDNAWSGAALAVAAVRRPVRTAFWLTTRALDLPTLPVRLAMIGLQFVREQVLSR